MYINQPNPYYFFVPYYIPYQFNSSVLQEIPKTELHSESEKSRLNHSKMNIILTLVELQEEKANYGLKRKQIISSLTIKSTKATGNKSSNISKEEISPLRLREKNKKKWSLAEDQILIEAYKEFGRQWIKISERLPSRTSKQVRDRYVNQIDPSITHEEWSKEEDRIILEEYNKGGARWAVIAKMLKNRSENQVKIVFITLFQKYQGEQHPYLKVQE